MNHPATIKDIAQKLDISVSTVSRALRDTHDVSSITRNKVLSIASELNYKPNFNATALAKGKTLNIAIILPFITNFYFSSVVTGIYEVANGNGYRTTVYMTNDLPKNELSVLQEISHSLPDGILVCSTLNSTHRRVFTSFIEMGIPVVFFDRAVNVNNASKVLHDDVEGSREAVIHLYRNGYTKIAHISGPRDLMFTSRRLEGYISGLQACQIPVRPDWIIHSGFSQESGIADTITLLSGKEKPDAIFAVNDRKAFGALTALKQAGIEPGKDFGLVGFTNEPAAALTSPSLTTIEEPGLHIGRKSCELLLKHILKKNFIAEERILPVQLIIRESSMRY